MSKITSNTKRILAVCLAVIMTLSVMGVCVYAEDPKPTVKSELVFTIKAAPEGADASQNKGVYVTGFTMKDTITTTKDGQTETKYEYRIPVNADMKPYLNVPEAWIVTIESSILSSLTAKTYSIVGIGVAEEGSTQTVDFNQNGEPITVDSDKVVSFSNSNSNIIKCIYIPTSVKAIEQGALAGCVNLALVSYKGTCVQWMQIKNAGTSKLLADGKKVWEKNTFGGLANASSVTLETAGTHVYDGNKLAQLTTEDTDYAQNYQTKHKVLCDVCGDDSKREAHKFENDGAPVYEFICKTGTQNKKCACGATDQEAVPAKADHDFGDWQEIPADESTADHNTAKQHVCYCKICNQSMYANHAATSEVVFSNSGSAQPKKGGNNYTYGTEAAKEAEVAFCYHYAKVYCKDCGKTFEKPESVGHVWGSWVDNNDAKFFRSGTQTKTCSVCGDSITRSYRDFAYTDTNDDGKIDDDDVTLFTRAFGNCYFGQIFGLPLGAMFFVASIVISGADTVANWFVDFPLYTAFADFMKKIR